MTPISTSSSSPPVESKTFTSPACSTKVNQEVTQPHDSFLKRSPAISSESLCGSIPKRKKTADSREVKREVRRQRNKQTAAQSKLRKKEKIEQTKRDNVNLKKELSRLKLQLGITVVAIRSNSEQSQQSTFPAKTTGAQLPPLWPKLPALITESTTQWEERCMVQPPTQQQSSKAQQQMKARVYAQSQRDAENMALKKIEVENANMTSEIEFIKKIIEQQRTITMSQTSDQGPSSSH